MKLLNVSIDDREINHFRTSMARWPAELLPKARPVLRGSLRKTLARVKTSALSGQVLAVRSGALRRSGFADAELDGRDLVGKIGFKMHYARTQEYGHPGITPKTKKYLALPLPAALTAAGVPRGEPKSFINTKVIKVRGKLFIVQEKEKGQGKVPFQKRPRGFTRRQRQPKTGKLLFLFFLTKGPVKIREKRFLRDALAQDRNNINRDVMLSVRKGLLQRAVRRK